MHAQLMALAKQGFHGLLRQVTMPRADVHHHGLGPLARRGKGLPSAHKPPVEPDVRLRHDEVQVLQQP